MIRIDAPTAFAGLPAAPSAAALLARLSFWRKVRAERRALSRLDARLLRDVGLDRDAADAEAARPFWSEPANRAVWF
jgi:Uncharacterized conserved small protein